MVLQYSQPSPLPQVYEEVEYQPMLNNLLTRIRQNDPNITLLESDSGMVTAESVVGYIYDARLYMRERAISILVDFATGPDLDQLGSLFSLSRDTGETDADFRRRIKLARFAGNTVTKRGLLATVENHFIDRTLSVGLNYHAVGASAGTADLYMVAKGLGETTEATDAPGTSSTAYLTEVQDYANGDTVAPLGVVFRVLNPTFTRYYLALTVTYSTAVYSTAGAARNAVNTALTAYLNDKRKLIPSNVRTTAWVTSGQITLALGQVNGVTDVSVTRLTDDVSQPTEVKSISQASGTPDESVSFYTTPTLTLVGV